MGSSLQLPSLLHAETRAPPPTTGPKGLLYANKPHQGQPGFFAVPTCQCSFHIVDTDDFNGAISQNSTMTWGGMHYPHQHPRLCCWERFPSAPELFVLLHSNRIQVFFLSHVPLQVCEKITWIYSKPYDHCLNPKSYLWHLSQYHTSSHFRNVWLWSKKHFNAIVLVERILK